MTAKPRCEFCNRVEREHHARMCLARRMVRLEAALRVMLVSANATPGGPGSYSVQIAEAALEDAPELPSELHLMRVERDRRD